MVRLRYVRADQCLKCAIRGAKDAWQWQDSMEADAHAAFDAAVAEGISLFDTAEVYGDGKSEELLQKFIDASSAKREEFCVATKFMPWFTYFRSSVLQTRFQLSKKRLGGVPVELYQIHGSLPSIRSIETWCHELVSLHKAGEIKTVGVSNFTANQVRRAHAVFSAANVPFVSNQIEYSLLRRAPEDDVIKACESLGVKIIAYSPLAMGRLTGKYSSSNPPPSRKFGNVPLDALDELLRVIGYVAKAHDATHAQIALAWIIHKGAFPIAGARNAEQARQNAGAMHVSLTDDEMATLDAASLKCQAQPSLMTKLWQE